MTSLSARQPPHLRMQVNCSNCNLHHICIPGQLSPDEIEYLTDIVRRDRTLQKGEALYHAGERFSGLFALKSGTAKLVHVDHSGNETLVALLLPGELLGFDGLASGRYLCSLIALEPSSYCELPSQQIEHISQRIPSLHPVLLQRTGEQFNHIIERISLSQRSADERLATFLLNLSSRYRERGFPGERFHLSLTRREIGNHLGLALETVSRQLARFEAAGMIEVRGKNILLIDPDSLLSHCIH